MCPYLEIQFRYENDDIFMVYALQTKTLGISYSTFLLLYYRKYCLSACDVEEPELKFNIDQYTDTTLITKPVIYISVQEIVDTHHVSYTLIIPPYLLTPTLNSL